MTGEADAADGVTAAELLAGLPHWRGELGRTTAVWATDVVIDDGYWHGFTGARGADYNIAVCHGGPSQSAVSRALSEISELGAPAIIMVAGSALADVQQLVEQGWVCVGAAPFMAKSLTEGVDDARVRSLALEEFHAARALLEPSFGLPAELTRLALPDTLASAPDRALWGLYSSEELVCSVATMEVDGVVALWSMATPNVQRRRGYALALVSAVLRRCADGGARICLLSSSPAGTPFYEATGFQTLERWQLWSRRRWVIGRF